MMRTIDFVLSSLSMGECYVFGKNNFRNNFLNFLKIFLFQIDKLVRLCIENN